MPQIIFSAVWRNIGTLLIFQIGLIISMAILSGFWGGEKAIYSAFLAGFCFILSTVIFALIVFGKSGARMASSIVRAFYRAEAVKLLITAVLMMLVFVFIPIDPLAFFATLCVMQLSYWGVLGLFKN